MRHRTEQNRLVFAAASAVIWGVGAAWAAAFTLQFPPIVSGLLAVAIGGATFYILNRRPDNRRVR